MDGPSSSSSPKPDKRNKTSSSASLALSVTRSEFQQMLKERAAEKADSHDSAIEEQESDGDPTVDGRADRALIYGDGDGSNSISQTILHALWAAETTAPPSSSSAQKEVLQLTDRHLQNPFSWILYILVLEARDVPGVKKDTKKGISVLLNYNDSCIVSTDNSVGINPQWNECFFLTLEALIDMPNSYVTDVYNDRVMITLKGVGWEGTYSFNINSLYVENAYYAAIDSWHTLTDSQSSDHASLHLALQMVPDDVAPFADQSEKLIRVIRKMDVTGNHV